MLCRLILTLSLLLLPCLSHATQVHSYSWDFSMYTWGAPHLPDPSDITGSYNQISFKDFAVYSEPIPFEINKHTSSTYSYGDPYFDKIEQYITAVDTYEFAVATIWTFNNSSFSHVEYIPNTDFIGKDLYQIELDTVITDFRYIPIYQRYIPWYTGTMSMNIYEANPVPEPATILLLASGIGVIGLFSKAKHRKLKRRCLGHTT